MKKAQYKFLKTLCDLFDGENYVPEANIRAVWPKCPPHNALLHFGVDVYFETNRDILAPGFIPTVAGFSYVSQHKDSVRNLILTATTLAVSVLTLFAAIFQIVQASF